MDLMKLAQEMSEEEQRYVREGFSSDEELSIYDLLFSESLSKNDIAKIKKLSIELLQKIKDRIAQMDHWTDKDETRATVQNLIRDELYMSIPDSMFDQLDHYREVVYEYVYSHYKEAHKPMTAPVSQPPKALFEHFFGVGEGRSAKPEPRLETAWPAETQRAASPRKVMRND